MNRNEEVVYETLVRTDTYGDLALDTRWDGAVAAEKARRVAERQGVQPQREVEVPQHRSSVRLHQPLFQKAQEPLVKDVAKVQTKQEQRRALHNARMFKAFGFIAIGIIMVANLGCVIINQMIMNTQTELVALQRAELELINSNSELKIAVEQLKGPERIREIASKELGMVVARDNVYVSISKVVTVGEVYRQGKNTDDSGIYALVGK